MEDKELLELAAKAAGFELEGHTRSGTGVYLIGRDHKWSPLISDNDALHLAGKLRLRISASEEQGYAEVIHYGKEHSFGVVETYKDDPSAAIRRAIVRAAATIGESK